MGNHDVLSHTLKQQPSAKIAPQLMPYADLIANACHGTLQQVATALSTLRIDEAWFERALSNLTHGCPVTAHIVAEQLKRAQGLSLEDVFRMEWIVSIQCTLHPDFPEGVRAQLVDKDKQPRWVYSSITAVPQTYVENHFSLANQANPLQDLR